MVELKFAWRKEKREGLPKEDQEDLSLDHQKRHIDFLKRLDRIIKVEKKNGSLVNVPDSNKDLVEIQRENNMFFDDKRESSLDPEKLDAIIDCITKGFSLTDTTHLAHCSATTVKHAMCNAGLSLRPPFRYRLKAIQNGKIDFYARSTRQLSNYTDLSFHKLKNKELLKLKGYRLSKIHKLWYQIPNNVFYSANNSETIYLKKGINSFENKEFIVQKEVR